MPSVERSKALAKLFDDEDSVDEVMKLVEELAGQRAEQLVSTHSPDHLQTLKELQAAYAAGPPDVEPGDVLRWKPGLKNRRIPNYGQPAIVTEVLDPPLNSLEESSGSAYFREPLTHLLGILDTDNELVIFHFDGSRFELYEDE